MTKGGELCLSRAKSGKTLADSRFDIDGHIALYTKVFGRKTNRTISQLHQVKRMIGGIGNVLLSRLILKLKMVKFFRYFGELLEQVITLRGCFR